MLNILVADDEEQILRRYRQIFAGRGERTDSSTLLGLMDNQEGDSLKKVQQDTRYGVLSTYTLLESKQGEDAVAIMQRQKDLDDPVTVALLDVRMPPGIDGLETARRLRAIDERVYIVIVTAYSDYDTDVLQRELLHDVVLTRKPFSNEEIRQIVYNFSVAWERNRALETLHLRLRQQVKKRTSRMEAAKSYTESIIQAMGAALFVLDQRGMITMVNPFASHLLNMDESLLVGRRFNAFVKSHPKTKKMGDVPHYGADSYLVSAQGDVIPVIILERPLRRAQTQDETTKEETHEKVVVVTDLRDCMSLKFEKSR